MKRSGKKSKDVATPSRPGLKLIFQWLVLAGGAGLLWLPYLWDLQSRGGYAAIAANHKGYLVGWSGWGESVLRHLAVDRYYSGWSSVAALEIALGLSWSPFIWEWRRSNRRPSLLMRDLLLGVAICLLPFLVLKTGLIPCLIIAACLGPLCWWLISAENNQPRQTSLGGWILLAWIAGLTLATPLYRPYPRLILPWMVSMTIASGIGLSLAADGLSHCWSTIGRWKTIDEFDDSQRVHESWTRSIQPVFLVLILGMATIAICCSRPVWLEDRQGLQHGADEIVAAIQKDLRDRPGSSVRELDCVIYVLAEPGLYYHLAAQEDGPLKFITQPASNLGMLAPGETDSRVPAYIVTGPHSRQEAEELSNSGRRVRSVMSDEYHPSDLVLLDDFPPAELIQHQSEPLQLWALKLR